MFKFQGAAQFAAARNLASSTEIAAAARAHSSLGLSHAARRNVEGAQSTDIGGFAWPALGGPGANE